MDITFVKRPPPDIWAALFFPGIRGRCPKQTSIGRKKLVEQSILWTNTVKPKLSALPLNPRVLRLGLEFNVKATSFFLASKVIVN